MRRFIRIFNIALAAIAIGVFLRYFSQDDDTQIVPSPNWHTLSRDKQKRIKKTPSSPQDLKKVSFRKPEDNKVVKKIEKAKKTFLPKKNEVKRGKRILLGKDSLPYQDLSRKLELVKPYDRKWKRKLGDNLLSFMPDDTKALVKVNKSFVQIKKGKGRLLEEVTIGLVMGNGNSSTYKALVDSHTGEILHTWDRSHYERVPMKVLLSHPDVL